MSKQNHKNSGELIQSVQNNMDKYQTYREIVIRYNKAIRNGFYLEAIFIDYAMIEDRLRSMLYHMAIFHRAKNSPGWSSYPFYVKDTPNAWNNMSEKEVLHDNKLSISKKVEIIQSVIDWAHTTKESYEEGSYLSTLKNVCKSVEINSVLNELKTWDDHSDMWTKTRNELTHELLNKNMNCVTQVVRPCAQQGMSIARKIDAQIKRFKTNNLIRNSIGAPTR